MSVVTDLAFVDGTLLVAGMSNEEFASTCGGSPSRSPAMLGHQPGDLPRVPRDVGDGLADPHLHPLRRRQQHPGQLHLHAIGALSAG